MYDFFRLFGGLLEIIIVLEKFVRCFGVKMYLNEKVEVLNRKGILFVVWIDNFFVLVKKFIIVVLSFLLEKIIGDFVVEIKSNYLFKFIFVCLLFKVVVVYSYLWWENIIFF